MNRGDGMRRSDLIAQFHRFLRAEDGATAIEYAMIASGVSIAIIAGVTSLGSNVKTTFYDKLTVIIGSGSGS
jgi:pilus assembly protein Flp/PilA